LVHLGHVTHFGDDRLNLYSRDLLFKTSEEVENHIITNFNSVINPSEDILFHCGDVAMDIRGLKRMNEIKCKKKILILGNYDDTKQTAKIKGINNEMLLEYFDSVHDNLVLKVPIDDKGNTEEFFVTHKPENMIAKFSIVGHVHALRQIFKNEGPNGETIGAVNVGVDAHHFMPVSLDRILKIRSGILDHFDENVFWL